MRKKKRQGFELASTYNSLSVLTIKKLDGFESGIEHLEWLRGAREMVVEAKNVEYEKVLLLVPREGLLKKKKHQMIISTKP